MTNSNQGGEKVREGNKVTPYAQAWETFRETKGYKCAVAAMRNKGMKQPYVDNILSAAFAAGYNQQTK